MSKEGGNSREEYDYRSSSESSDENDDLLDEDFVKDYIDEEIIPADDEIDMYHDNDELSRFQTRDLVQRIKDLEIELERQKSLNESSRINPRSIHDHQSFEFSRNIEDRGKVDEFPEIDYEEDILSEQEDDLSEGEYEGEEVNMGDDDSEYNDMPSTFGVFEKDIEEGIDLFNLKRETFIHFNPERVTPPVLPSIFFDDEETPSDLSDDGFDPNGSKDAEVKSGGGRKKEEFKRNLRRLYSNLPPQRRIACSREVRELEEALEDRSNQLRIARDRFKNIQGFRKTLQLHRDFNESLQELHNRKMKQRDLEYMRIQDKMFTCEQDLKHIKQENNELKVKVDALEKKNSFLYDNYTKMKEENNRIRRDNEEQVRNLMKNSAQKQRKLDLYKNLGKKKMIQIQQACLKELIHDQKEDRRIVMKSVKNLLRDKNDSVNQITRVAKGLEVVEKLEKEAQEFVKNLVGMTKKKSGLDQLEKINEDLFRELNKNILSEELLSKGQFKDVNSLKNNRGGFNITGGNIVGVGSSSFSKKKSYSGGGGGGGTQQKQKSKHKGGKRSQGGNGGKRGKGKKKGKKRRKN